MLPLLQIRVVFGNTPTISDEILDGNVKDHDLNPYHVQYTERRDCERGPSFDPICPQLGIKVCQQSKHIWEEYSTYFPIGESIIAFPDDFILDAGRASVVGLFHRRPSPAREEIARREA